MKRDGDAENAGRGYSAGCVTKTREGQEAVEQDARRDQRIGLDVSEV